MAKPAGLAVNDGRTVTFPTNDDTLAPGDIVELGANGLIPYDSATATRAVGVISEAVTAGDFAVGDSLETHVTGVVVTNAAGVARGDTVADDWVAFSDDGGQYKQHDSSDASLETGTAAVHLG